MFTVIDKLNRISVTPLKKDNFDAWLEMGSAFDLLREDSDADGFVVYASNRSTFIHAILAPVSSLNPPDIDDLMSWSYNPSSSWDITVRFSEPRSVWISPPLDHSGSKTLDAGEQLVFARNFEGRPGKKSYYEILQKFTHLFDLHYLEERHAYCRLDGRGDVEDVIGIAEIPGKGEEFGTNVVVFNRDLLDEYLVLTDSAIVRTFDFTRYQPSTFNGWNAAHDAAFKATGISTIASMPKLDTRATCADFRSSAPGRRRTRSSSVSIIRRETSNTPPSLHTTGKTRSPKKFHARQGTQPTTS